MKTTMGVQAISMAVLVLAAMLLMAPTTTEGRAMLGLGKLIDHFFDCPPPPAELKPQASEPAYSAPYYSPQNVEAPAPDAYSNVPEALEYQSPPGPPYSAASPPVSPISEPAPEYKTPPAGGYWSDRSVPAGIVQSLAEQEMGCGSWLRIEGVLSSPWIALNVYDLELFDPGLSTRIYSIVDDRVHTSISWCRADCQVLGFRIL